MTRSSASRAGAHAEYICVRESGPWRTSRPASSFEEAAAVCDGALLALACLSSADLSEGAEHRRLRRLRIRSARQAVQLAKHFGAHVTAVCNTKNVELVRSLGADDVVDYLQEDFTRNGKTYDVIFDAVGKHSFRRCRRP